MAFNMRKYFFLYSLTIRKRNTLFYFISFCNGIQWHFFTKSHNITILITQKILKLSKNNKLNIIKHDYWLWWLKWEIKNIFEFRAEVETLRFNRINT